MPVLGLVLGDSIARGLGGHANLLAGLVLCLAGVFALVQQHGGSEPTDATATAVTEPGFTRLVVLAAALSIDNLAIGFALGATHVNVVVAALVIGVVSVASDAGRPGARPGGWARAWTLG